MGHFSEQNFYEILEITSDATSEEIQKAFYKAKATYSPSSAALYSVFSETEAQELLRLIDEAYSILSNSAKRREYDKNLGPTSVDKEPTATFIPAEQSSNHEELPDFMLPEDMQSPKTSSAPEKSKNHKSVEQQPETFSGKVGYGKTIMSHYNVDEQFEKEILEHITFDGTFLQKIRHYKNISMDQLSETSRISRAYLVSIETNDFHALPAAVYVRGFIASVAKLLGIDEKKTTDSYMKLFKENRGK